MLLLRGRKEVPGQLPRDRVQPGRAHRRLRREPLGELRSSYMYIVNVVKILPVKVVLQGSLDFTDLNINSNY